MHTNKTQNNGMIFVGGKEADENKTAGRENKNDSILVTREQQILVNASKSADPRTDLIKGYVLTWLPSVLGVFMTGIIFSILMLIILSEKHCKQIFHHEDKNLLPQD